MPVERRPEKRQGLLDQDRQHGTPAALDPQPLGAAQGGQQQAGFQLGDPLALAARRAPAAEMAGEKFQVVQVQLCPPRPQGGRRLDALQAPEPEIPVLLHVPGQGLAGLGQAGSVDRLRQAPHQVGVVAQEQGGVPALRVRQRPLQRFAPALLLAFLPFPAHGIILG